MTRTGSALRKRWPAMAAFAVVLALALAAGALFAVNEREQPVPEAAAEHLQPDFTDPGLYAEPRPPAAARLEPAEPATSSNPATSLTEPPEPDHDPGAEQVAPEGSGVLARWLDDRPDEMGPFSIQDAMAADSLDVDWKLYQAVAKDLMTQAEADTFRDWHNQRPSVAEAPELLDYLPTYPDQSELPKAR